MTLLESQLAKLKDTCLTDQDRLEYQALITGTTCHCGAPGWPIHTNTCYARHLSNWAVMCDECQAESDAYYEDLWREYYAGLL